MRARWTTRLSCCAVLLLLLLSAPGCSDARSTTPRRATTQYSTTEARVDLGSLTHHGVAQHLKQLAALTRQVLNVYINKSGPTDVQYWSNGSFVAEGGISCWVCDDSAATAAAVLSQERKGNIRLRDIAIATYSHAIGKYELPSGVIVDANGKDGVVTGFFAVQLATTYLELKPYLSAATRKLWANAITRIADYLIKTGALTYYINGNVNLRQTEVMWLAWAITGQSKYYADYQQEYRFTIQPPAPRWSGYGLHLVTPPTIPLGVNGAGYLTELGTGTPGFDPSYTLVQLDTATSLYVLTHDQRYIWLMNVLLNQLRPLVDTSYVLNAQHGTRKDDTVAFLTAAPFVLLMSGDRPDLSSYWLGQLGAIHTQYVQAESFANAGFYTGTSNWLALPMLAVQYPDGILGKPCSPKHSAECAALF
jgi:hypothetical protein